MIDLHNLKNQNIHIVGLSGTEGAQLAKFLHSKGCSQITAHDFCEEKDFRENFMMFHGALPIEERKRYFAEIEALPIKKYFGKDYLKDIEEASLVFVSQGWYLYDNNKPLEVLKDKGVPFHTILNLYLTLCQQSGAHSIGITGSNGKTTTSRLIYDILKKNSELRAQNSVVYVGNDRHAVQDLLAVENLKPGDFLVLEISNRQLKLLDGISPNIGVITNITNNHLNEHPSYPDYIDTKSKIWTWQTEKDVAIINLNDQDSRQCLDNIDTIRFIDKGPFKQKRVGFSHWPVVNDWVLNREHKFQFPDFDKSQYQREKEAILNTASKLNSFVYEDEGKIFALNEIPDQVRNDNAKEILNVKDIQIPGTHNLENVLAAVAATHEAGVEGAIIKQAVIDFKGVEKRLEFMEEIHGVRYYNDLSSTTPISTLAALDTFGDKSITLIIGGDHKMVSYSGLALAIIKMKVNLIVMEASTASDELIHALEFFRNKGENLPFIKGASTALEAFQIAAKNTPVGGVVLLSPAGEGFFSKYLNRRTGGMSLQKILSELKDLPQCDLVEEEKKDFSKKLWQDIVNKYI